MATRTIAITLDSGDFDRRDGMTGGFRRMVADAHYQLSDGRGRIAPYLTTLTLVAALLAVWAGLCAI
jgi:hypothetical protein